MIMEKLLSDYVLYKSMSLLITDDAENIVQ